MVRAAAGVVSVRLSAVLGARLVSLKPDVIVVAACMTMTLSLSRGTIVTTTVLKINPNEGLFCT